MNLKSLQQCPLFLQLSPTETELALECLAAYIRNYQKNDYIFHTEDTAGPIGIVLTGKAHVIREDYWGNREVLSPIEAGDMFGEAFACAGVPRLPVSVIAAGETEICFLDYPKLFSQRTASYSFQFKLIQNMLQILAGKNITLTQKMEHISKRTLREKILSYLSSLAIKTDSSHILIPFNRQELANYLSVDRSALSRELSIMQKEGLIQYTGSEFRLL